MKKYYMKETGNEVNFGDTLELDFIKKTKNGVEHEHIKCPFHPSIIPLLKKKALLVEKEVKDVKDEEDFIKKTLDLISKLVVLYQNLEKRTTELEEEVSKLMNKNDKAKK